MKTKEAGSQILELVPNQNTSTRQFTFAYTNLDPEILTLVQQHTNEIKGLMRRTAQDINEIGQKLIEVKQYLGHGNFTNWLKLEFNWSVSTATKFMHVAEQLKSVNFTNLNISASALYTIAAPSTSKEARTEVLKRAVMGENISYTQAKKIVSKYKQKANSQPEQLKSTNLDDKARCNGHNSPNTVDDFREEEINSKTNLPSLQYQLFSVDTQEQLIVNIGKQEMGISAQTGNNITNESVNSSDSNLDTLITEIATNLKKLTPEQLALLIDKCVEIKLNTYQLEVLSQASHKALQTSI
ncbi:hypothetical protein NIES4103_46270 [Nostoc sp. NIES-4103]|nr:hypothetical protein NIES4103_46270 [Nostoc sp. NIES-4103]